MSKPRPRSAEYFDQWYSNMAGETAGDEIKQRHLGLPPRVVSSSLLPWDGLVEVTGALNLRPGSRLVDLACGRGGYGLEMAAMTGAALIGGDFSAEAIRQAGALAQRLNPAADFRIGDLAATGLPTASADAVVCIDAIQFKAEDESFQEMHRILAPGGHLALTVWEALDRTDERVPELIRALDVRSSLQRAGFADVEVHERPDWFAAEHGLWVEAAALDPGDNAALRSLHDEAVRVLPMVDLARRILATARVDR